MSDIPSDRQYTKSHEWIEHDADSVIVGITDHAQESLGDLVFVELPEPGDTVSAGEACAVVESVKAASDIFAPADGEVAAVNEQLAEAPELINDDPYGEGWLMKLKVTDDTAFDNLLDADDYEDVVAEEDG